MKNWLHIECFVMFNFLPNTFHAYFLETLFLLQLSKADLLYHTMHCVHLHLLRCTYHTCTAHCTLHVHRYCICFDFRADSSELFYPNHCTIVHVFISFSISISLPFL